MGFDALATSIGHQLAVVGQAPVPFAVCVLLAGIVVWRAMAWRYDGIIARLTADVAYLEKALTRDSPPHAAKAVVSTETAPATVASPVIAPNPAVPLSVPAATERVFVDQAEVIEVIATARAKLSGIQADKIIGGYKGKWMNVTGTVFGSGIRSDEVFVSLTHDENAPIRERLERQVTLWFGDNGSAAEALKAGETVTAQGCIENIDELGFILTEAELLP